MPYFIRAFCLADQRPDLGDMLAWLEQREIRLKVAGAASPKCGRDWQRVSLVFRPGRTPIIAECLSNEGPPSPAGQEIHHFVEEIGPAGKSPIKRRIIDHLKATTFIIKLDVPTAEMDDSAWDANGQLLTYLLDHCDALIHADGEGFYEGSKLILPMEAV